MARPLLSVMLLALLTAAGQAVGQVTARADAVDVADLIAQAGRAWDLSAEDAVLLLEEARFTLLEDGRLRQERHRLVWIGSDHAVDLFADLRLPWDSDRQTFAVKTLRVWRDGRWIDARPTAVVETTPHALRHAPDYSGIRETMLLHDGVEIPCVLECAYAIEDQAPPRPGVEGEWVFAQTVPTLTARLVLSAPTAARLRTWSAAGVPEPAREGNALTWTLQRVEPRPLPATADPGADLARVQWSTFDGWTSLGDALRGAYDEGAKLDAALRDSLANLLDGAPSAIEKARRILDFTRRAQRRVVYEPAYFWARPRSAARVFDTAYGADLDLAVLAAALLREAGFTATPAFVARAPGECATGVATLARFGSPGLWFAGDGVAAYWDAGMAAMCTGGDALVGRLVWRIGTDAEPGAWPVGGRAASRASVSLDLAWDAPEKGWGGEGWYEMDGAFCPRGTSGTEAEETRKQLERALGGIVAGLAAEAYSPQKWSPAGIALSFKTRTIPAARDSLGRVAVVIGAPAGGLAEVLPRDVRVTDSVRGSVVRLPGALEQVVSVSVAPGDLEIARLPAEFSLANAAGAFDLRVERREARITIRRAIRLAKARYEPAEWPALRALLLAEMDAAHRTVLLR